jgi:hypothetical protein
MDLTRNRIGWLGISLRETPILPLLTANIDDKATNLFCGVGILLSNKNTTHF